MASPDGGRFVPPRPDATVQSPSSHHAVLCPIEPVYSDAVKSSTDPLGCSATWMTHGLRWSPVRRNCCTPVSRTQS